MRIAAALPYGYRRIAFPRIGSTNDEAKRLAVAGAAAGLVVTAERQTAGRGRQGHAWESPSGNLYLSLLLRPDISPVRAGEATFVLALALAKALAQFLPPERELRCKWPNDILIDGRKVSGILLESSSVGTTLDWLVAGIGINLVHHPADARWPATDLAAAGASGIDFETGLEAVLRAIAERQAQWLARGFGAMVAAWNSIAYAMGETVEIDQGAARHRGRLLGIDGQGALMLETSPGTREAFRHGSVTPSRG